MSRGGRGSRPFETDRALFAAIVYIYESIKASSVKHQQPMAGMSNECAPTDLRGVVKR